MDVVTGRCAPYVHFTVLAPYLHVDMRSCPFLLRYHSTCMAGEDIVPLASFAVVRPGSFHYGPRQPPWCPIYFVLDMVQSIRILGLA